MAERIATAAVKDERAEGMGQIRIKSIRLLDGDRIERQTFEIGEKVNVVVEYEAVERVQNAVAYAATKGPNEMICVASSTRLEGIPLPTLEGPGVIEVEIPELLVTPGHYVMDFLVYDQNYDYRAYFLGRKRVDFDVSSNLPALNKMYGVVYQKQNWKITNHEVTTGGTAAI